MRREPKTETITYEHFTKRLAQLIGGGSMKTFPRRPIDRSVLFKSILLVLAQQDAYSESELNAALQFWLDEVARFSGLDHVQLRRMLVDEGYLERTRDGSRYWVPRRPPQDFVFEAPADELDVADFAKRTREARLARKLRRGDATN